MKKLIDTFIFDLDGTIIDTPNLIMNSFKFAIKEHTDHILTKDETTNVLGHTLTKAFEPYANDLNHLNKMIKSFRDYSYKHGSEVLVYEDVIDILTLIKEKSYKLAIVTSKSRIIALKNLEDLKLANFFDLVVTYDDTLLHKPNKEPLMYAIDKLESKLENSIYIGDHENDVKAGKNANMLTGLMKYSHRLNEALDLKPDFVFDSFNDIKNIIK